MFLGDVAYFVASVGNDALIAICGVIVLFTVVLAVRDGLHRRT